MENEEMLRALEAIACLSATKRGELLIRENERPRDLFLLVDGVFRGYFYDDNGRDITECLAYRPGTPVMACTELGMPSTINLAALNDSVCLALPIDELRVLMVLYPDLLKLSNKLLLDSLSLDGEIAAVQIYGQTALSMVLSDASRADRACRGQICGVLSQYDTGDAQPSSP